MERDVEINIVHTPPTLHPLDPRLQPPVLPPMAMAISQAEQDHHAALRLRSYELALERGHIRR